ncbi:hypothetical protein M758_11G015800 [Ceratodon purpureus]|uniref:Uncharacterized protein n=1 Tax=Ceratodon purpureus TaxID=3225 RepID=A0A8T0G9W9_CERPU|nr:hypothetical protein KC19_11G017600 [Ceratodon purpureus]KAG0600209.1 hypothetical protein M758_11G015800 [Ceratodon purpureus]
MCWQSLSFTGLCCTTQLVWACGPYLRITQSSEPVTLFLSAPLFSTCTELED